MTNVTSGACYNVGGTFARGHRVVVAVFTQICRLGMIKR